MENKEIKVTIYCIVDPFTLKVRYIGRTKLTLHTRLQYHLGKAKSYKKKGVRTTHVHNWLNQCVERGKKPIMRKLCEVIGWSESHIIEKQLINKYKDRLVNLDDRGEGLANKIISEEQKKQISETLKRRYASGEIVSLSKKEIHVYDLKGNYIKSFNSLKECGDELNLDEAKLITVRKGQYKQWKGYQFSETKVEKMLDISNREKGNWTIVEILNNETGDILKFNSIANCKLKLDLVDTGVNLQYLAYSLKRKYGNKYSLLIEGKPKEVNIIEKVFIRELESGQILEFENLRKLGEFLGLTKSKRFKKYLTMSMKHNKKYEFVELPKPDNFTDMKKFYQ